MNFLTNQTPYCSAFDFRKIEFEKSSWTDLISTTASVACKIHVRNRQKIKFVQLDFSQIKCRSTGGSRVVFATKTTRNKQTNKQGSFWLVEKLT